MFRLDKYGEDKFSVLPPGSVCFNGSIDDNIRFIEKIQLMDVDLWRLFVNQYRHAADEEDGGWRCEYWGKMMRGACFTYRYTQNQKLYRILEQTVREMIGTQDEAGRFSTYTVENEFNGWDIWGRKYILLGLQYFTEICDNPELVEKIIRAMCRHADYIVSKIGSKNSGKKPIHETSREWGAINSSSILEPMMFLYEMVGNESYLDFASYIVKDTGGNGENIFELAYKGESYPHQYPVVKAYEMMSCFEGLIEYYKVTKIEKWRIAAENFVNLVMEKEISIIGCAGCTHELFDNSSVRQSVQYDGVIQETCVTVTWMKLCFKLMRLNGNSVLGDCMEVSMFNALLGAINSYGNKTNYGLPFDSYSPLLPKSRGIGIGGYRKMENGTFYGCCAAIGAAGTGLMGMAGALKSHDGVVVNFFISGEVNMKTPTGHNVKIITKTKYPSAGGINITVEPEVDERFTVYIRIPLWSRETSIVLNEKTLENVNGGEFFEISRLWKREDKISIMFDMSTHVLRALKYDGDPEAEYHVALKRGPIVLARDARFGEDVSQKVDIDFNDDNIAELIPSDDANFERITEFKVPVRSSDTFHVVNYSAAGKTWDEDSKVAVWMPINR